MSVKKRGNDRWGKLIDDSGRKDMNGAPLNLID